MTGRVHREWVQESPYEAFFDFIDPAADRFAVLRSHIQKLRLNSAVLTVEGNRHFFIFPRKISLPQPGGSFPFSGQNPVVLTAHYDRVPGSPGANDNSAAVFQLLKTALRLDTEKVDHWMIIFTDKEELVHGEGISRQGSYSLAKKFRQWGLSAVRIFNFDACGRGNTFVFSATTAILLNKGGEERFRPAIQAATQLREHAFATAHRLNLDKVLTAPTPFSDDAGFLRGGIPAQTITMLPAEEAAPYASLLHSRPNFASLVISGSAKTADRLLVPETWRHLNGPCDNHLSLTPPYFDCVVRFAAELCRK